MCGGSDSDSDSDSFYYGNLQPTKGCAARLTRLAKFITGQNEREETTQDAIVTKSAAFASYEILPKVMQKKKLVTAVYANGYVSD
jgi:hypothetical protein